MQLSEDNHKKITKEPQLFQLFQQLKRNWIIIVSDGGERAWRKEVQKDVDSHLQKEYFAVAHFQ